jgi:Mg-chelatase subunit ChlD
MIMRHTTLLASTLLTALALTGCDRADEASATAPSEAPPPAAPADGPLTEGEAGPAAASPAATAMPEAAADEDRAEFGTAGKGASKEKRRLGRRSAPAASAAPGFGLAAPSPGVRAGEWDDNANYREFQRFLETSSRLAYHRMDLRNRRFIVVRDNDGRGVPSCRVRVSDGQRQIHLTTAASGRAILFPHAEGLFGNGLTATARCAGDVTQRTFNLGADDAAVDLRLKTARVLPQQAVIDVAFILDTTGSMAEEIAAVKSTIQKVASSLSTQRYQVRLGLVEYKDRTDELATKVYPMSTDLQRFAASVNDIRASGGGDIPEDAVQGLEVGVNQLAWSNASVARVAFMIGDAPPHLDYQDGGRYEKAARTAAHRGIKIHTIAASGMDDLGQVVWRQIAQYTGATNMFVLRGGAGPQSKGGGDAKSSCGGTHSNYSSGNLDALIVTKVERELKALQADPMAIAGLGQDERAKPCSDRVAQL